MTSAIEIRERTLKANPDYEFKVGAGKGLEPAPWCKCHDRNPCPNGDIKKKSENMYEVKE